MARVASAAHGAEADAAHDRKTLGLEDAWCEASLREGTGLARPSLAAPPRLCTAAGPGRSSGGLGRSGRAGLCRGPRSRHLLPPRSPPLPGRVPAAAAGTGRGAASHSRTVGLDGAADAWAPPGRARRQPLGCLRARCRGRELQPRVDGRQGALRAPRRGRGRSPGASRGRQVPLVFLPRQMLRSTLCKRLLHLFFFSPPF